MDIKLNKKPFQVSRQTKDNSQILSEKTESTKGENIALLQKKTTRSFGNKPNKLIK